MGHPVYKMLKVITYFLQYCYLCFFGSVLLCFVECNYQSITKPEFQVIAEFLVCMTKPSRIVAKLLQTRSHMVGGQGKGRWGSKNTYFFFVIRKHSLFANPIQLKNFYNELLSLYLNESFVVTILPF